MQKKESNTKGISRRSFMKGLAGGAGAAMASTITTLEAFAAAQENDEAERARWVQETKGEVIQVNDKYKRHDGVHNGFNELGREAGVMWNKSSGAQFVKNVLEGKVCTGIDVGDVGMARIYGGVSVGLWSTSSPFGRTNMGYENKGFMSWVRATAPMALSPGEGGRKPDITDPVPLTRYTKAVARMVGADIVGVAAFDERWVLSRSQRNPYVSEAPITKEIRIADVEIPGETDEALLIPSDAKSVIVMAFAQNRVMIQTSPSCTADGIAGVNYGRMGFAALGLAEFIRTQGYWAIPSTNCTGLSVPTAIQAGLGEAGRHGLLITPDFGPNVRLCRVYTNMPLTPNKPISFGVQDFCESCMKCARECPSKAITEGPKSWSGFNECNANGTYKWYNDVKKCMYFWVENGASCANCVSVCPFTKGEMWAHRATEWSINNLPFANGIWLGLDDAFGYGERRDPSEIWGEGVSGPFGINDEIASKIKRANGDK